MAPDGVKVRPDVRFCANHQSKDQTWGAYLKKSRSRERARVLGEEIDADYTLDEWIGLFQSDPLFNTHYSGSFGTLYTAIYRPKDGAITLSWPGQTKEGSVEGFTSSDVLVSLIEA